MTFGHGAGVVEEFDADVGLGTIVDDEGRRWLFHCTVITDGSRTIDAGTRVRFDRVAGGPGRWEAVAVSR